MLRTSVVAALFIVALDLDLLNRINVALDEKDFDLAESYLKRFRSSYPASSGVKGWDNGNGLIVARSGTDRQLSTRW